VPPPPPEPAPARLRRLLETTAEPVLAPGVYDALGARLVQRAGFSSVYLSGAGVAASLGYPDFGLVTQTEMLAAAQNVTAATGLPVICDADTGYGNEANVARTYRALRGAGVAALHIEDQDFPKRCGHLAGKTLVEAETWLAKVAVAVEERGEGGPLVIARTDAIAVSGFAEAIRRANLALAGGADMAFVEAPQTPEQLRDIPRQVQGPCLLNLVHRGRTPAISVADAGRLGYRLVIASSALLFSAIAGFEATLDHLRTSGLPEPTPDNGMDVAGLFERLDAAGWDALAERRSD
jgi:2-methylisocitrate lyase-like PEP mutase family enzyme